MGCCDQPLKGSTTICLLNRHSKETEREKKHSLLCKHASAGGEGSLNAAGGDARLCRGLGRARAGGRWSDNVVRGGEEGARRHELWHLPLGECNLSSSGILCVYVRRGGTKQTSHLRKRALSGDGDHAYPCTTEHTSACSPPRRCAYIRPRVHERRRPRTLFLSHEHAHRHANRRAVSCQSSNTWEGSESTRWLQGSLENDPSAVSPQREVALTELVIIQSKHFSWRM